MAWRILVAAAAVLTMGADPAPAMKPAPAANPVPTYLGTTGPDAYKILPPAPVAGTIRYDADRRMFRATRKLKDTPRWALALNDDNGAAFLTDLSCAIGVDLTTQNAPRTRLMIARVSRDSSYSTNIPKDAYKRLRPFLIDKGPTCIDQKGPISQSFDYPSGHNTYSWAVGLILAELVPDRSTEILVRARAFGESRMICGVHNMSAVEAGRTNGSIVVAGLHGSEEFRRDMDAARTEIAAARKAGPAPDPAKCAAEAELLKSPY
ncbi:phosphatase PAP2 family protein [Phenylobacterium sp.]|uniref:acid phosphatase n=1 Tax=Phenylobacterium sp. TaxID=1871053 RepID=UPI003569F165